MGKIFDTSREQLPVTWDALAASTKYEGALDSKVEFIKYKLFATIVDPTLEESVYNPLVINYAAKEVALQVIPTAIDYWKEKEQSRTTQGTQENISWTDRVRALSMLQERLMAEIADLQYYIQPDIITKRRRIPTPKGNTQEFVTPDPNTFPKEHNASIPTNLPWGPPIR